jgi:hypothetical protein
MPVMQRGRTDRAVTTPCLRAVARTSVVDRSTRHEKAIEARTSDAQATHRAWSRGWVFTEATGRRGGNEDGGAAVRSRRRAVADSRRQLRCAPALRSEEGGGEWQLNLKKGGTQGRAHRRAAMVAALGRKSNDSGSLRQLSLDKIQEGRRRSRARGISEGGMV